MTSPDISIIIRTLNEARYLGDLLSCIKKQITRYSHEVVLIDSGSTDATLSIAKTYNCNILHINRKDFSFGRSLNRACDAANGSFLALISGHCIPINEYWLEHLVKPIADGTVDYSYGKQSGLKTTYWSEARIFSKYFPEESRIPQQGFYCNNANSALLASTWKSYQFNEELTGLEDMDFAKRLVLDGGRVGYVAEAHVYHIHHEDWRQIQRRFEREALALKEICPEVFLRRRDIARYFFSGVIGDLMAGLPTSLSLIQIYQIFLYRFNQYLGSYRGNHFLRQISREMRDSYFYPLPSDSFPLTTLRFFQ